VESVPGGIREIATANHQSEDLTSTDHVGPSLSMAYLKRKRIGTGTYLYVVRTYRVGTKVRDQVLQYLGSEAKVPKADADAAVAHWNRWTKSRRRRRPSR
jgi:hypothetical protein